MGEGFLRVSYRQREKGVGQLDNAALIRNICRFPRRREKDSEWWERHDCILLHLCDCWTGFSLTYYHCLVSVCVLISLSLFLKDHTCVFTSTSNHILIVFGLFEAVDHSKLHIQYDASCCTMTLMPRTINMIFATLNTLKRLQEIESEEKHERGINELLNMCL